MRIEFAEQWNIPCVVIDGTELAAAVIYKAHESEATYDDGEDVLLCIQFPDRPMELYTVDALTRSLQKTRIFPMPPDDDYSQMIDDCQARAAKLSDWETTFIDSVDAQLRRTGGLSTCQAEKLEQIWERATS
jgi:hypothetical protein